MSFLQNRYVYKCLWKRLAAACFDGVSAFFFIRGQLSKRSFTPEKIKKILVIRLDRVGDIIMTKPALASIHRRWPQAQIDLLVTKEAAPLFEDVGEIHKVRPVEKTWFKTEFPWPEKWVEAQEIVGNLKKENYDLGIDFRGDLRNILLMVLAGIPQRAGYGITGGGPLLTLKGDYSRNRHQVLLNMDLAGVLGANGEISEMRFPYSREKKDAFWQRLDPILNGRTGPRIVIHPGASAPSKRWPAARYRELFGQMQRLGPATLIVIGTDREKALFPELHRDDADFVDLRGRTTLADLAILFDRCDLFVGSDSGPAHLAAAQGMQVLIIASGTNDIRVWHPWTSRLHIVSHSVPCSPCEELECPLKHHECIEKIAVEEVFYKIKEIFGSCHPRESGDPKRGFPLKTCGNDTT